MDSEQYCNTHTCTCSSNIILVDSQQVCNMGITEVCSWLSVAYFLYIKYQVYNLYAIFSKVSFSAWHRVQCDR